VGWNHVGHALIGSTRSTGSTKPDSGEKLCILLHRYHPESLWHSGVMFHLLPFPETILFRHSNFHRLLCNTTLLLRPHAAANQHSPGLQPPHVARAGSSATFLFSVAQDEEMFFSLYMGNVIRPLFLVLGCQHIVYERLTLQQFSVSCDDSPLDHVCSYGYRSEKHQPFLLHASSTRKGVKRLNCFDPLGHVRFITPSKRRS